MSELSTSKSPFIPHSPEDEKEMLRKIGVASFEELLQNISPDLVKGVDLSIPSALSEYEVVEKLKKLARLNIPMDESVSFLGAGSYNHFTPAAIDAITSRSEFYTAYTPYQPEVSQGTLQSIYEFQTMICEISGMEVANASLYDGASAAAEACLFAERVTGKRKLLISNGLFKRYLDVVQTYLQNSHIDIEMIPVTNGCISPSSISDLLTPNVAGVIIQSPNRFGGVESLKAIGKMSKESGAMFIVVGDPFAFALFASPGECGADAFVGEGHVFGTPISFGGPYIGLFATKMEYVRKIPGRVVGKTVDVDGKPGYVLTLQTREQHIRREKATSNICTNQALIALCATIYLSLIGKEGFKQVATLSFQKAHYLSKKISELPGYRIPFGEKFFREFVVQTPVPASELINAGVPEKIFVGTPIEDNPNFLRVAVTEKNSRDDMDKLVHFLGRFSK